MPTGGAEGLHRSSQEASTSTTRDSGSAAGLLETAPSWTTTRLSRRLAAAVLGASLVPWLTVEWVCAAALPTPLAPLGAFAALVVGLAAAIDLATGLGDRRLPPRRQWRLAAAIAAASGFEWIAAVIVLVGSPSRVQAPWIYLGLLLALVVACVTARPLLGPDPRLLVVAAQSRRDAVEAAARATRRRVVGWMDPAVDVLGLTLDETGEDHDYDELALEEGCCAHLRDIPGALRHRAMYLFVIDLHRSAGAPGILLGSPQGWGPRALRRGADIAAATLLVGITAPLLLVSWLALRIGSRKTPLRREMRVGRNGRRFTMYMLRTTPAQTDERRLHRTAHEGRQSEGILPVMASDTGASAFGRWVHRLRLDALPTLWNVLNGTMSLTGPRPALPTEVELFTPADLRRLRIKPGLVDLRHSDRHTPVSGARAAVRGPLPRSHGSS